MPNPRISNPRLQARVATRPVGGAGVGALLRCRGFTLLEVMVALLLLAIIMTTSVSMLFVNLKGWEGLNAHSDAMLQEHLIQKRVASMVEHLTPLVWRGQRQRHLAMRGETRELHFVSKSPQQYRAGGLFEYLLIAEGTAQQGLSLVLYLIPLDPNASTLSLPENGTRRVLMTGLEAVEFSYFGSKQARGSVSWHDSWEVNSARYPELIRMTLRSAGEEGGTRESFFRIHEDYPVVVQREQ